MHAFRIVNVFTVDGDPFSGNPLCVFEDARGLSAAQMQSLARQMNLSETTFVLPPTRSFGGTSRIAFGRRCHDHAGAGGRTFADSPHGAQRSSSDPE